jgi:selenocysteine lyase/cysteine desulfurase
MAGLTAGIDFLSARGIEALHRKEVELKGLLRDGLEGLGSVRVLSPPAPDGVGIVTFVCDRVDPATFVDLLDRDWDVLGHHGLNCAPEVHRLLGTLETGAVRLSLGWDSTVDHVHQALRGVEAISAPPSVPVS